MIQTYRDPKSGKIFLQTGEHIADFNEYARRVRAGEISGVPKDISQMPNNIRTPDGGIMSKASIGTSLAGLDSFNNQTQFLDAVKDIIKRKQQIQQPLTEQKAYWRTLQRDTTPFGGARDSNMSSVGAFNDTRFREMSPADQASIRASRDAAASAHLQGIAEEEKYRGTRVDDIINSITDLLDEKDKLKSNELINAQRALNILKSKKELGLPISDEEYKKIGITSTDGKIGGSVSWRHNNPGNIKFGDFAKQYGATKGQAAKDGGNFAIFPDVETGKKAMMDLLTSKNYKNLSVDAAMKRWSGGGYGIEVWGDSNFAQSTIMKNLSDNQLKDLINHMIVREGWKEGTTLGSNEGDLAYLSELTGLSVGDLNQLSPQEQDVLKSAYEEATKTSIKSEIKTEDQAKLLQEVGNTIRREKNKNTDPKQIYAMLVRVYNGRLNASQLKAVMIQNGYDTSQFIDSSNIMNQVQDILNSQ